ncbi:DUF1376 domain-containing protein [Nisaea sediminum]|uniref:DUF1376 domain-containing protein n=1 Tax=Nisaea sediminum TaxID=2775867 RepID=UPI001868F4CC|nr:DUF1376 domain-containing protein [Nisaea sediminum]
MPENKRQHDTDEDLFEAMADVDLRDLAWMALDTQRLLKSDFAITATGDEFRAAMFLWCEAWHQVPAASLPDDDAVLASLAGYGRAVGEWLKVREKALHGFMKGPGGRLYHPVICEKVKEALSFQSVTESKRTLSRNSSRRYREKLKREAEAAAAGGNSAGGGDSASPDRHASASRDGHGDVTVTPGDALTIPNPTEPSPPLSPPRKARGRKTRGEELPEGWKPDAEAVAYARRLGLDPDREVEKFTNHIRGACGGRAISPDWNGRFRSWCDKAPGRREGAAPSGTGGGERINGRTEGMWRSLVGDFKNGKRWIWGGAAPGKPGCDVPPHIQREFGFEPVTTH